MNSRNRAYRVELAKPEHDAGLAKLLEESSFTGPIQVSYHRRPSVIESFQRESQEALIYVLIDETDESVVGMGAVTIRSIWLQGVKKQAAYLSGLRITPAHQKAFLFIPQMYEAMYQSTKDRVDVYLTTIVSANHDVIKMFEKKRRSMPEYHFVAEIETFFLGPKKSKAIGSVKLDRLPGTVADETWFKEIGARFTSAGYVIEPTWKQYHVAGYQGAYSLLAYLPTQLVGWPRFPKAGTDAHYLAAGVYTTQQLDQAVAEIRHEAIGFDFVMLSALKDTPLAKLCHRLTPAVYQTRLYEVIFHDNQQSDLSGLIIDVVFL